MNLFNYVEALAVPTDSTGAGHFLNCLLSGLVPELRFPLGQVGWPGGQKHFLYKPDPLSWTLRIHRGKGKLTRTICHATSTYMLQHSLPSHCQPYNHKKNSFHSYLEKSIDTGKSLDHQGATGRHSRSLQRLLW